VRVALVSTIASLQKRVSAKAAMNHRYFDDLDKAQFAARPN